MEMDDAASNPSIRPSQDPRDASAAVPFPLTP